jgi:hypothetical protein
MAARHLIDRVSILQNFKTEVIFLVEIVKQHLGEIHRRLQDLGVWERARVKQNLHILLFDVVSRNQNFLRRVLWISNPLVYRNQSKQSISSNPVVDIDSFCKRLNVVLLGAIEVAHLKFKLEAFEIVEVLPEMVLLKKLKSEPLLLFHEEKSLVILDSIT